MQGKKRLWDPIRKVLMNKSIKKGYICEPTDTVHHCLNSEQNFRNQSCTSSTIIPFPYAPALVPLSAALQHNTLSECVRKRWGKAPVQSFCCEDDTTQSCAFLRLYRINTLVYNKSEKTFHIYTKPCQASQTTFTSLPQRWLLVIKTKITLSSWL